MIWTGVSRTTGLGVAAVVTLSLLATSLAAAKPAPKKPGGNASQIAAGKKLYDNLGCGNCHIIGGQGGAAGPKLDGTGKRRDMKFLVQKLKNPKFNMPQSIMPPMDKPDKDVQAVAAYLMSLK
jgi:mono/diheme cytochrome c family protein